MAFCKQCGKKGLFLSIDANGLCKECVIENTDLEITLARANANNFYGQLVASYNLVNVDVAHCSLFDVQQAIAECDLLISLVRKIPHISYFSEIFSAHCSYVGASFCLSDDLGHVSVERLEGGADIRITFNSLIDLAEQKKAQLPAYLESSEQFTSLKQSISFCGIQVDDTATPCSPWLSCGFPLELNNITKRTSLAKLNTYFVVDIETTGLDALRDEIIQVTAIKFIGFSPVSAFSTYVKPRQGLKLRAAKINGITDDDVLDAPYIETVIKPLDAFLEGEAPIIGHNLTFDCNFLMQCGLVAFCGKRKFYDTLELSKREFSYLQRFSLDAICRLELKLIRDDAHDARSDALATGLLFKEICSERIGFEQ